MPPQEVILATSSSTPFPYAGTSSSGSSSNTSKRANGFVPPAFFTSKSGAGTSSQQLVSSSCITLNDLQTGAPVQSYKPSAGGLGSLGWVQSRNGLGGGVFVAQEGKALLTFWSWQKQQVLHRIHLPEKLACFTVSPHGMWAVGGSSTGHVYLWEIASGLLLASFDAAYRRLTVLKFTPCSTLLLIGSEDSSISVYSIHQLVSNELASAIPSPYAVLGDHTLGITDLHVGKGHGVRCRVWSTSLDGTLKQWALDPPTLLTSFTLPATQVPTCVVVDPLERALHVGTSSGEIHHVRLFRRRREMGRAAAAEGLEETEQAVTAAGRVLGAGVVAVGGAGLGAESVKVGGDDDDSSGAIRLDSPITCLELSLAQDMLLCGTASGHIYVHALPSHQLVRTLTTHVGSPVSHLSTMLKPPDMAADIGGVSLAASAAASSGVGKTNAGGSGWPVMEVRAFERMRVGRKERDVQEVSVMLRPITGDQRRAIEGLGGEDDREEDVRSLRCAARHTASAANVGPSRRVDELEAQVEQLQSELLRAKQVNERMWTKIVDKVFDGKS